MKMNYNSWQVCGLLLLIHLHLCYVADVPTFTPTGTRKFEDGHKYYRYLVMGDDDTLYVGARNQVFKLSTTDIADRNSRDYMQSMEFKADDVDVYSCTIKGRSKELDCQNHIRTLAIQGNKIYVCGTGAYHPIEFVLYKESLNPVSQYDPTRGSGIGKCPYSPDETFACVNSMNGNPGSVPALYSGTVIRGIQPDPLIHRPELEGPRGETYGYVRTITNNNKWLNDANFIAAFDVDTYIYFFFREVSIEYMNMGKTVISRVARICKSDQGGSSTILENQWTTFTKARITCSIPAETPDDQPFYFNEIRDVQKVGDTFYGLFTTPVTGLFGSAVCEFTLNEINRVLGGSFKEQGSNHDWIKVPESSVPTPRPGVCSNGSSQLPVTVLQFIKTHPIMYNEVSAVGDKPIYYSADVIFDKLVVKQIQTKQDFTIFYLATDGGKIHKVVHIPADSKTRLISKWTPFDNTNVVIWSMQSDDESLFLGTDTQVVQVKFDQCAQYTFCTDCVQDPSCGWDRSQCKKWRSGFIQDVLADPMSTCGNQCYTTERTTVRVIGNPIHLECRSVCGQSQPISWFFNQRAITLRSDKYLLTATNGLIVMNATKSDEGQYVCYSGTTSLIQHYVSMPECQDQECIWQEEFRNWCAAFDNYRKEFNNWLCVKNECFERNNCDQNVQEQCSNRLLGGG